MAADHDDLLDIREAAQFLNVSETSLRRWTNAGRLACVRVGRKRERRFRRADLLAFVEEQPAGAPAARHLCGLYATDLNRATLAAAFLGDGFEPGNVAYLAAPPAVRDEVVAQLEQRRPSLPADIAAGRFVLTEYPASGGAQDVHDRWDTHFAAATRAGARSLRAVGDVSSGPGSRLAQPELVEMERLYDELARRWRVASLCLYDVRHTSPLDLLDVLKGHHDLFRPAADRVAG
jgi:excisionase family DNA binding protein